MKRDECNADNPGAARTPFERFEDMARRIVNVPRKDVPPPERTPRTPNAKPSAVQWKPKRG